MALSFFSFVSIAAALLMVGCSPSKREAQRPASEYVDAKLCAGCHASHAKTYRETGMARSFYRAVPSNMVERLDGQPFHHQASDRYYAVIRRGDRYFLRRHQVDAGGKEENVMEVEIHYVMGSGNHARSYLGRTAQNRLVQMPITWYPANGGYFAMSPGYDRPDHLEFRRKITYDCFFCHDGYPEVANGSDSMGADPVYPETLPEGIDCQRCHGPGRSHVDAAGNKRPAAEIRKAIVNPARLNPELQMDVCMQCHLETTSFALPNSIQLYGRGAFSFRPGEPLADFMLHFDHAKGRGYDDKFEIVSSAYRLRRSACFQKSAGRMTCTTCHNPHVVPRGQKAVDHYTAVCRGCHNHVRLAGHPSQPNCLPCHMPPRRTDDVVHSAVTDHRILRRKPARDLLAPLAERHEVYRGEVVLYYPESLPASAERDLYLSVAQVGQQSNLAGGIERFEKAIRQHQPKGPEFYFDLAEGYVAAQRHQDGIALYQAALDRAPRFVPAIRGMGSAALKQGDTQRAITHLEQARSLDPKDAPTLHELGRAYYQAGRGTDAIAALEAALRIDPDLPEVHDSLGNMLFETGDRDRAEQEFREAIRQQPDLSAAHGNLANVRMAKNDFPGAEVHYKKAIRLSPGNTTARYGYAAALASRGRFDEAETQMEETVRLKPGFAEALEILGNLYARRGAWQPAIRRYQEALRARPGFGRAHLGLGTALAATRDVLGARSHLTQAASDPDPAVRQEAQELLAMVGR
ncbi:MAG: tetratricopeptide repeat protein [Bryobacteraceae bacterium]